MALPLARSDLPPPWQLEEHIERLKRERNAVLLAHYYLTDGPLLPALQHWYGAQTPQRAPLPHLILWGAEGLLGVGEHEGFLMEQRAVVFSFPLDLDAILGVVRALVPPR